MTHEVQAGFFAQRRVQGNHLEYVNGGFTLEEHVLRQPGVYNGGTVPFHRLVMNGPRGEILIPLAVDICVEIDIANKRIRINPPDGLLELNEKGAGGRRQVAGKR